MECSECRRNREQGYTSYKCLTCLTAENKSLKAEVEFYKQSYYKMKALLIEILYHENCPACCGRNLPSLGWYEQIREIFKSQGFKSVPSK